MSGIVLYNALSGVLAIINPSTLDALFPGSAALFGTEPSMLSRVLGSYALSIAGVRIIFVMQPASRPAFWSVLWTFAVFESMFFIEVAHGLALSTVAFGVAAGTVSVILMLLYLLLGWLDGEPSARSKAD